MKKNLGDFKFLIMILGIFYSIAVSFWLIFDTIFYLLNFFLIGTSLGLGVGLMPVLQKKNKTFARKMSQILVGGYIFFGLGTGLIYIGFGKIVPENMQIEGFWFLLLAGLFEGAVINFTIAKIIGPLFFNRAWCGWACWTTAVLDLLPWNKSPGRLPKKYGSIKYIFFIISTAVVCILVFKYHYTYYDYAGMVNLGGVENYSLASYQTFWEIPEFSWFLLGNVLYFVLGYFLAAITKDNRAFCKYICPVTIFMKIGSRFSIMKIKGNIDKCTSCKICEKNCLMDINITEFIQKKKRVTSSECIICYTCINSCPTGALSNSFNLDGGFRDNLRTRR